MELNNRQKRIAADAAYLFSKIDLSRLEEKTILVTGAAGFLGSNIIWMLVHYNNVMAKKKIRIIAHGRDILRLHEVFGQQQNLIFHDFELSSEQPFCQIDYIIHAASKSSPTYFFSNAIDILKANTFGTENMLRLAVSCNASLVFISSGEVYGQVNTGFLHERSQSIVDPLDPRSCYAESKRCGESFVVAYCSKYRLQANIARLFHTYGAGMEIIDNGQAVPSFLYSAINNDAIYMHSEGKAVRDFTYVTEAIEAIFRILFMGAAGEAYNVGAGFCSSIAALAETVASISGKTVKIDALKQSPKYLRSTIIEATPDATQLRKLGWNPEVDIPTGIKMTLESYK